MDEIPLSNEYVQIYQFPFYIYMVYTACYACTFIIVHKKFSVSGVPNVLKAEVNL